MTEKSMTNAAPLNNFGMTLSSQCLAEMVAANTSDYSISCSFNVAATGEGFTNASEISATLANVSATHSLGPALSQVPQDLEYTSSTIGVATSCQPISRRCNLAAPYGAATNYRCSPAFYGNIQVPQINTIADYWFTELSTTADNFMYGAEFFDWNMSAPYAHYQFDADADNHQVLPSS